MVERPFELPFESLIKEARSISVYDGSNEKTALQPWLVEVNDIILLTNPGPQTAYIFNIIMSKIQGPARQCTSKAIDLINEEQCYGKIKEIHEKGNHRGIQENFEEIKHLYYYKKIIQLITKYINNCEVCNLAKYDRNPVKVEFKLTETPNDINQIVHLDVFLIGKRMFFTGVDKFSKHMYTKELTDKNAITFIQYIRERNSCLGKPRKLVADNEFNMVNVKEFSRQESIEIHFTSPKSHTGNSDISRAHSSLLEHIRTLTLTERDMSISEKVLKATEFYNTTIHSTIHCKPLDVQLGQVDKSKIAHLMQEKKEKGVSCCNKNRQQQQNITHDKVYIKNYVNERYKEEPKYRKATCTSKAIDLINEEQCYGKIKEIHEKGNHRGIQENFEEIKHLYYYKKIIQLITKYINNCEVCNLAKYDRNPVKVEFKLTETPNDINQIVHLDVFLIGKRMFFTGVDKFSKHMYTKELTDKNAITFIQYIRERNSCLGKPRKLVADNEFNMVNVKEFSRQESIEIHFTSPKSHTGNSDISRAHSSLLEHIRTLTLTERDMSISEKVLKATEFYNTTIHSTIHCKPLDVQLGQVDKSKIAHLMQEKKEKGVSCCNKNRQQQQNITHDKVYIKNYVNERYKEEPKYRKATNKKSEKIFSRAKRRRSSTKEI
ncbi:unnamed protein product [Hermetia illucens]|uniref:RNA-directed DNA polymerase n=1 Tax=Hermetia illucens TaxID=343691 RepID=A0A7R8V3F8_HERIL|nr:unnamed protein product [Hermetia illucens]